MTFNYGTLKQAAKEGSRLGKWKDLPVFSCDRQSLTQKGNGAYYVVYDHDNAFVKKSGSMWFRYGYLDESGSVHEEDKKEYFPWEKKAKVEAPVKAEPQTFNVSPGPVADVKLELDVEGTLKKAREMTIEDLLKGFNYGL